MQRKTITIDDELYNALQRIRAAMIAAGKDESFTGTVEVVLLNGIMNAEKINQNIWDDIEEFQNQHETIRKEIEQHTEKMLKRIKFLMENSL